jgi:hydroxymethylpyrimidine pyrophosphatase-like HAD family hydrolase
MLELVAEVDRCLPEIGIQFSTRREVCFAKDNGAMRWFRRLTGLPMLSCDYRELKEPVLKVVFGHEQEEQIRALAALLAAHPLAERFDFIRSERRLYEILPKGNSKGELLCKMAELLGISMDKTIAVGDYNNDVSMIRRAGIGFAVANAVPEAKAVADYVTVSNDDHAIAAIVEGLEKGLFPLKK